MVSFDLRILMEIRRKRIFNRPQIGCPRFVPNAALRRFKDHYRRRVSCTRRDERSERVCSDVGPSLCTVQQALFSSDTVHHAVLDLYVTPLDFVYMTLIIKLLYRGNLCSIRNGCAWLGGWRRT